MDMMHDEPEPTAEERDHAKRRRVVLALLCLWLIAMSAILAQAL